MTPGQVQNSRKGRYIGFFQFRDWKSPNTPKKRSERPLSPFLSYFRAKVAVCAPW